MKSWYYLSFFGILSISLTSCSPQKTPQEIASILDDSVVLITYPDKAGHGTGFFVPGDADKCTVLTARHVVADQDVLHDVLTLKTSDDQKKEVKQIQPFKNHDLALLTFSPDGDKCPYKSLQIGDSNTVERAHIIYISGFYNNGSRSINHFVNGGVTAIDNLPEGYGIAYQSATYQGMSGSPVVDTTGKVVAVHGRSDIEVTRLAEIQGVQKPQLQALDETEVPERGARIGTFKWGIPINLYLANIPVTEFIAVPKQEIIDIPKQEIVATLSAEEYYKKGNELRVAGKYDESIESYDKAIELDPDNADTWNNRGVSLEELEKYEEAISSYSKAIKLEPDFTYAWNNKGFSLRKLERYEEALVFSDKAIELDPDYTLAWFNRGVSLEKLERYEQALESYDKALEIDPDYSKAINNRKRLLEKMN